MAFTHALWGARAVDALVWVPATSQEAIITGFAQAAVTVGAAEVAMSASVQAAVRAYLPPADFEQAVLAAAEALMQAWPEADGSQDPLEQAQLEQVLRDCTGALWAADGAVPRPAEGGQHARPVPLSAAGAQAYQVAQPHQSRL